MLSIVDSVLVCVVKKILHSILSSNKKRNNNLTIFWLPTFPKINRFIKEMRTDVAFCFMPGG
jgi:hypothetical protein